jgi:hypothetical protein
MRKLEEYHLVWLARHPWRSEDWLRAHLLDGFDIHHIDGDHGNNDDANLVLIEHSDHFMLHGLFRIGRIQKVKPKKKEKDPELERAEMHLGWELYRLRSNGSSWHEIAKRYRMKMETAIRKARKYAKKAKILWPPEVPSKPRSIVKLKIKKSHAGRDRSFIHSRSLSVDEIPWIK